MTDDFPNVILLEKSWRFHLNRGMRYLREGHAVKATQAFEKAYHEAPDQHQVQLALGRQRMRQGRYDEAASLLRQAYAVNPASVATVVALSRVLGLHQGALVEAFQLIHTGLSAGLEVPSLQAVRGELLLEEGAYLEARSAFGLAMDSPKAQDVARIGLARTFNMEGIALSERGEDEPAIFAFKRAADLDEEWSGPWVNMGVVFGRMGKMGRALDAYEAALERDPENGVATFNQGTAYHERGDLHAAVASFEILLAMIPDYPHVRGSLANVLAEMKEWDRAIALFLEELDIDEECSQCWSGLGMSYIFTGNLDRGEQCLVRALELDAACFNANWGLATLYVAQKRFDAAEDVLGQAFSLDPHRTRKLLQSDSHFNSVPELSRFHLSR